MQSIGDRNTSLQCLSRKDSAGTRLQPPAWGTLSFLVPRTKTDKKKSLRLHEEMQNRSMFVTQSEKPGSEMGGEAFFF